MLTRLRPRLTYANVISTLCLFILLGGGAFAAVTSFVQTGGTIRGCVSKSGQLTVLKKGTSKCKKGLTAISWSKGGATGPAGGDLTGNYPAPTIKSDALTGAKVDESTLDVVPNASHATSAGNASQLDGLPASAYFPSANVVGVDRSLKQLAADTSGVTALDLGGLRLDLGCTFDNSGTPQQVIEFSASSTRSNARITWEFVHGTSAEQGETGLGSSTSTQLFQRAVPSGDEAGAGTFVYRDDSQTIALPFRYSVSYGDAKCEVGGVATRAG